MRIWGAAILIAAVTMGVVYAERAKVGGTQLPIEDAPHLLPEAQAVRAILYTEGRDDRAAYKLPVEMETVRRIRLFDRRISYRNDRKACAAFQMPIGKDADIRAARARIEAYNDDEIYDRAVWFEVDGVGGYLNVQRVAASQVRGTGTLAPGEHKAWTVSLDAVPVTPSRGGARTLDALALLRRPGEHRVCSWVSTYGRYGPGSWVTLDLEFVSSTL